MKAWYISPERIDSRWNLRSIDDRGWLNQRGRRLHFRGKRHEFRLHVHSAALIHPAFPYGSEAVLTAGILTLAVLVSTVNETLGLSLGVGGGIGAIGGLIFHRFIRVVRAVGVDEQGQEAVAYFHMATGLGWGGLLGGNEMLVDVLSQAPPGGVPVDSETS